MFDRNGWISRFLERGATEVKAAATEDFVGVNEWKTNWKKSAIGASRLVTVIKGGVFPGARNLGGVFRGLVTRALMRPGYEPLNTDLVDPSARFSHAQQHHMRSESGISKAIDVSYEKFLVYLGLSVCLISLDIATARSIGNIIPWWLDIASRISPIVITLLMAIRAGFENWLLRNRQLKSISEYLYNPEEWWAHPAPGWVGRVQGPMTMLLLVASAAVVAAALLSSAPAFAEQATPGLGDSQGVAFAVFSSPGPSDFWYKLLGYVFPQVGPVKIGSPMPIDNAIGAAFGALSAALMTCSTAFLGYQIVIGMGESAHSGEPLGNRYHTMWGPIRVAYGIGLLAPISGGYCLAQMLVLTVAIAGGQVANAEWSAFVDNLKPTQIPTPALQETLPLIRDTMILETCHAVGTHLGIDRLPGWPKSFSEGSMSKWNNALARGSLRVWYDVVQVWDSSENTGKANPIAVYDAQWDYGVCGTITAKYAIRSHAVDVSSDPSVVELYTSRINAYDELRASLRDVAVIISNSVSPEMSVDWEKAALGDPPLFDTIMNAKKVFDKKIVEATQAYTDKVSKVSLDVFQKAAKTHGWISAGPYYMTLARLDGQVLSLTHVMPSVTIADKGDFKPGSPGSRRLTDPDTGALPRLYAWWDANISSNSGLDLNAAQAGRFNNSGSIAGITDSLTDLGIQEWVIKQAAVTPGQGTGLQQMADFGNLLLMVCELLLVALGAGAIFGGAADLTPTGMAIKFGMQMVPGGMREKLVGFAVAFVGLIAMGMLIAGVMHAYILPMMPFLLFLFAVMDMLVIVICGVIAAPIWALMHVTLEGDEMFKGKHAEGYMILFNLLLRPGLTLFGLFFSMHLFEAMIWLMSVTVYPAMASAVSGHFFGLVATMVYVIVVAVLDYQIAIRSFHLITQVPSRVTRWFGASPDGDGGEGQHSNALGMIVSHTEKGLGMAQGAGQGAAAASAASKKSAEQSLARAAGGPGAAAAQGLGGLAAQAGQTGKAANPGDVGNPRTRK